MQVTASDLGYSVDALIDGAYATDYYLGNDKIDLVILGSRNYAARTQDLEGLPMATPSGALVPLASLATVRISSGPEQVNHRERQRAITIQVTPPPDVPLETAIEKIDREILLPLRESGRLGVEYTITMSGTADKLLQTWLSFRWVMLLALLVTYLLMAALFESWLFPLVIIMSVPLGAVGGVLGLHVLGLYQRFTTSVFGWPASAPPALDVLTMLGFVILIGTAVNNAILIVHQSLNFIHEEGHLPGQAILESVRTRIRPIFMTTATTVFGLMPLVLFRGAGSELYRGLGPVLAPLKRNVLNSSDEPGFPNAPGVEARVRHDISVPSLRPRIVLAGPDSGGLAGFHGREVLHRRHRGEGQRRNRSGFCRRSRSAGRRGGREQRSGLGDLQRRHPGDARARGSAAAARLR